MGFWVLNIWIDAWGGWGKWGCGPLVFSLGVIYFYKGTSQLSFTLV